MRRRVRIGWLALAAVWIVLLPVSRLFEDGAAPTVPPEMRSIEVPLFDGSRPLDDRGTLAWHEWGGGEALPLLALHGSPGSHRDFRRLGPRLAAERRVLAPDLPGFGVSERRVPDYSIRAHAAYALELLDRQGIERAHLLGFSMGGGVALEMWRQRPEKVASIVLLSSIGVQELELLGSYGLNRMIHGLQLGALWLLHEAVPHFGLLDGFPLDVPYARNFFDTDQRPLRAAMREVDGPLLIVHGDDDFLVPQEAAAEHARLMPQAELRLLPDSHFFVFRGAPETAATISAFLRRVDGGEALTRADVSAAARARAREPWDPSSAPTWRGPALLVVLLLLALATFVSEDLTCIGAGLLVAQGRLALFPAALACFLGIFLGDLGLYALGRWVGRPVLRLPPLRWWVSEAAVEESAAWFRRRGAWAIGLGRFVPGTRLPTYLAAGILRAPLLRCAFWFLVAAAVWTPLLVGLALVAGSTALHRVAGLQRQGLLLMLLLVVSLWLLRGVVVPLLSRRGRRRLLGRWRRWSQWEFWPPWLVYPPVVAWIVLLGLRHRGLTVFTCADPGLPAGGFLGESKSEILRGLSGAGDVLPRWRSLPAGEEAERLEAVRDMWAASGGRLVLKPDVGQRGQGVVVAESLEAAEEHVRSRSEPLIAQEFVPGREYGVFYWRRPDDARGSILSITEKLRPTVEGDGESTLEELVLRDPRAVALAEIYLRELGERRQRVPAEGETVVLQELGTHARGAIFRDGARLATEALARRLDEIAGCHDGFYFGRFDLRVPSETCLREGRALRVIELNGVTSESTEVYDPEVPLIESYRRLFRQWRLAFEIGAANRDRGCQPAGVGELLRLVWRYRSQLPW